jgi:hypothetical protein
MCRRDFSGDMFVAAEARIFNITVWMACLAGHRCLPAMIQGERMALQLCRRPGLGRMTVLAL